MTLPDGPVSGTTRLYRRIPPSWLTPNEDNCRRVSSAAFRDREASVFLEDALKHVEKRPIEILVGPHVDDYLVSVTAEQAVSLEQDVVRSPIVGVQVGSG